MVLKRLISPSILGIDIQADWLKLVQMKKTRHGYYLENAVAKPLPSDTVIDGKIRRFDCITHELTRLAKQLPTPFTPAVISLSSNLVRMQQIALPEGLTEADIRAEISLHLQRDLPGLKEALNIDFAIRPAAQPGQVTVFFAAVRQDYLDQCLACFNTAGIPIKIVDIDIFALHRAVNQTCLAIEPSQVHAIAQVRSQTVLLILFNHQDIIFHHQWDIHDKAHVLTQIKHHITRSLTALDYPVLDKLGLFGITAEASSYAWVKQIVYPNIHTAWQPPVDIQDPLFLTHPDEFLLAAGAAMREVPRWL